RRLQTLQVVRLDDGTAWSLTTTPLDWPEAAEKLVGGGGLAGWQVREVPLAAGSAGGVANSAAHEVRVSRPPRSSLAAQAGLQLGDLLLALDGLPVTNAVQVQSGILLQPAETVALRVRGQAGEKLLRLTIGRSTNPMGPELDLQGPGQLTALL